MTDPTPNEELRHQWKEGKDGEVDTLAYEGFDADGMEHSGPVCVRCGHSECYWCRPAMLDDDDCRGAKQRERARKGEL